MGCVVSTPLHRQTDKQAHFVALFLVGFVAAASGGDVSALIWAQVPVLGKEIFDRVKPLPLNAVRNSWAEHGLDILAGEAGLIVGYGVGIFSGEVLAWWFL